MRFRRTPIRSSPGSVAAWVVCAACSFGCLALSGCGGGSGATVASVNGTAISRAAFGHWIGIFAAERNETAGAIPRPPHYSACVTHLRATDAASGTKHVTAKQLESRCASLYATLRETTMGFLLTAEWLLQEAPALGVKVPDSEVKRRLTALVRERYPKASELQAFLKSSGYTMSDLLLRVKASLLTERVERAIVKRHAHVSEAEVTKYYDENKSHFGTPEKRAVYIVLTKTEAAANAARKEVESGKSISSVAKKVSIDPTSRTNGGLLGEVIKGEEEKALDAAIFSARTGVLSGPVKTNFGYYIFEVKGVAAGSQQSLAQAKKTIKSQVASSNENKALSAFIKGFKQRWSEQTDCSRGFVVRGCRQYKAPSGSATSGG